MIKVRFQWTNNRIYDSSLNRKVIGDHEPIPDQEFNNEKEMLEFALSKYQTIIVSNWKTDEKAYGLSTSEEDKQYDYEIELYNDYRE
jgi:hypothetical protein